MSTKKFDSTIQAPEITFLRELKAGLNTDPVNDRVNESKYRWRQHVNRLTKQKFRKKIFNYHAQGRRDSAKPRNSFSKITF